MGQPSPDAVIDNMTISSTRRPRRRQICYEGRDRMLFTVLQCPLSIGNGFHGTNLGLLHLTSTACTFSSAAPLLTNPQLFQPSLSHVQLLSEDRQRVVVESLVLAVVLNLRSKSDNYQPSLAASSPGTDENTSPNAERVQLQLARHLAAQLTSHMAHTWLTWSKIPARLAVHEVRPNPSHDPAEGADTLVDYRAWLTVSRIRGAHSV
jgi:hypothetical protein